MQIFAMHNRLQTFSEPYAVWRDAVEKFESQNISSDLPVYSNVSRLYRNLAAFETVKGKMQEDVRITEVPSDYFKREYFAERPSSERLVNQKLNLRGLNVMRHWKEGLKEYLGTDYQGYLDN